MKPIITNLCLLVLLLLVTLDFRDAKASKTNPTYYYSNERFRARVLHDKPNRESIIQNDLIYKTFKEMDRLSHSMCADMYLAIMLEKKDIIIVRSGVVLLNRTTAVNSLLANPMCNRG